MITEVYHLFIRSLKKIVRMPAMLFFALFMPLIWILLFSQLFEKLADLPGFPTSSYLDFFVAGVVLMTVLSSSMQSGMAVVMDMDSGYLDKLLVAPINRFSILFGRLLADGFRIALQASVILIIALLMGASIKTGVGGFLLILAISVTFGIAWAGISNIIALVTKNSEATMMFGMLTTFPLIFMSTALMPIEMQPDWLETVAKFNPASYVVDGIRSLIISGYDWTLISQTFAIIMLVAIFSIGGSILKLRTVGND